ncbi:ADP-ribosylglycohydrolase family protein [Armatimonas sp.]|uniref:ADP-ribosylglycohydrolase family protein n=1 Tax=Armatimonas sp. TaxID=1872638 RepID=UPI00286B8816|nr:ADP-ribosylglycohydrolase family protein [Armatimonas sp.]
MTAIERARLSLDGLSVGDGFGEGYFSNPNVVEGLIAQRALPGAPWRWTDDAQMAISIVAVLEKYGEINQDVLALQFGERYEPGRGYGPAMHDLMRQYRVGGKWTKLAAAMFDGQGSFGNGSAMRVAPLGAFFADDLEKTKAEAEKSAVVTHASTEGIAGAIAVAIAAAVAWQTRGQEISRSEFLEAIVPHVPDSLVRAGIVKAIRLEARHVITAVAALGNGTGISCQDTVPFCLWCAGTHLDSYEEALWLTVAGLGDRDTTCAIVGGIVSVRASIPAEWLAAREPLDGKMTDWD